MNTDTMKYQIKYRTISHKTTTIFNCYDTLEP